MSRWIWQQPDWPTFQWEEKALLAPLSQARLKQGKLLGLRGLLDAGLSREARAQILVEECANTSAIEGERFDLDAIRSSVARHLGLPTAGLPAPPRTVDGLVEVLLDATTGFDRPLTLERLCGWQAALFPTGYSGLYRLRAGELRSEEPMRVISGAMGRERVHFEAPPQAGLNVSVQTPPPSGGRLGGGKGCGANDLPSPQPPPAGRGSERLRLNEDLGRFLAWFADPSPNLDGLLRAGLAHLWFVTLHPFEDGNGRLARAITDMALCQDEGQPTRLFSLSAQIMRNRESYYTVLENTQRGDTDVTHWLAWFLAEASAACDQSETTVERVIAKARFWLQHQHTALNERQRKALNRLLDAGAGGFEGGMNTRKYVSLNKTSRATAYRELADLVAKGCLAPIGEGRGTRYELARLLADTVPGSPNERR